MIFISEDFLNRPFSEHLLVVLDWITYLYSNLFCRDSELEISTNANKEVDIKNNKNNRLTDLQAMLETLRKTKIENEKEPIDVNANVITENVKAEHPGDKVNKKETKPKRTPITWPWIIRAEKKSKSRRIFCKKKEKKGQSTCKNTFYMKRLKTYFKTCNLEYIRISYHWNWV